jgi:peroxiredoxin
MSRRSRSPSIKARKYYYHFIHLPGHQVPSKKAWAQELGVEHTQLLADFWKHGGFAKELGIFLEDRGISKRANIILDENGQVAFVKIYPISEVPDIEEIIETLKSLEKKENEE